MNAKPSLIILFIEFLSTLTILELRAACSGSVTHDRFGRLTVCTNTLARYAVPPTAPA